jgi:hypothetical protein
MLGSDPILDPGSVSPFDSGLGGRRWLALLVLALSACSDPPFDTTRKTDPRGSLGEEIFKLLRKDLERDDDRRAQGFDLAHDGFVGAIDHLFPPGELSYDQDYLVKLLPLYDDRTVPQTTEMIAASLDRLSQNSDAVRSLAAIEHRIHYVDRQHEEALVRRIAHYADYMKLANAMLNLELQHDGLDDQGNPNPMENDAFAKLMRAFAKRLKSFELSDDTERTIVLGTDLLMREDPRFSGAQTASTSPPQLPAPTPVAVVVARDPRGMARVHLNNGVVDPPFVDINPRDGLPDIDALGRFVSSDGSTIDLLPFSEGAMRDSMMRPLASDGNLIYEYVNVDQTMMAGLLRDGRKLIAEGVPMKAVRTLDTVLGQRTTAGTYAPDDGLLDIAHAIGATADVPNLPATLELLQTLLTDHQDTLGWLDLEIQSNQDIADTYNVSLRPGNTFFNDFMDTVRKILLVPGLGEDLLVALRDPAITNLPAAQVPMLSSKKTLLTPDDVSNHTMFNEAVDRTRADSRDNQSLMQRSLHLLHDTHGASYQPSFIGIPLGFIFKIDDLAEFYLESIIGKSTVPSLVATLTGLSTTPTPQELAVFINKDQTFGNPQGNEGIDVKDNDGDTLFAFANGGMSDSLKPLIQVFYDHGQMPLLFELFDDLHMNYATQQGGDYQDRDPSMPRYSHLAGIRNYEPLMIDQFQHAQVIQAVQKLVGETDSLHTSDGETAHAILLSVGRKLLGKNTNLTARDGRHEVDIAGERITPLSPFDMIRGARARLKSTVAQSSMSQSDWDAVVKAVNDTLLLVDRTGPQSGRLHNPRALPVLTFLLSFLEDRAKRHQAAGGFDRWISHDFETTIEDGITSPELPAIFDIIYAIDADSDLSSTLVALRDELLADDKGFPDLLVTACDGLETMKDASLAVGLMHYLGSELDPDTKLLFQLASFAKRSLALDTDQHTLELARRSIEDSSQNELFAYGLTHAIRQANRVDPLSTDIIDPNDVLQITSAVSKYMTDDQHGLEKFYDLVAHRK